MITTQNPWRLDAVRMKVGAATLGAAALALLGAGCSRTRAADVVAAPPPPTVAAAKVARGDLSQTLTLAAAFRPFQEIDVHAKVAGFVKSIAVDVGDRVQAGQLLAVLEIPELQDEQRQDEAAVRRSEQEIRRARADVERAESAHQVAHLASTRLDAVIKDRPNLVAQQDVDDATARDRVAEAQVATAQAALAAAEQQLEVSKATLEKTQTLFAYARITAPFAGVITKRYADTGSMIQAGTASQTQAMPLVKLSENSLLRLTIPVPESAVSKIRIGEPVNVRVTALNKTWPGVVARFSDSLNEDTRMMHTEVDVKNADLTLVPGMFAEAMLTLDQRRGVLVVPVQAIDREGETSSVMVVTPANQIEVRKVDTGLESSDRVEVRTGLKEGDTIVVAGRGALKDGLKVTPKIAAQTATEAAK